MSAAEVAPAWRIKKWLNTAGPIDLQAQRGRVVVACAFQMLCPGCVAKALPQMRVVRSLFQASDVEVVGLHTVFEHHEAMTVTALRAFLHEYQIRFPVGVDAPDPNGGPMPQTMRAYGMRGTPTVLLIDRAGRLQRQIFGHIPDMQLGAEIMSLVSAPRVL